MREEEKKLITREKHPGRVAHEHKPATLMKKRKEEILYNKELSTEQSTVQFSEKSTVQPTEQSLVQSTEQPLVQTTVQSNDAYVYGVGILAVFGIGVCVFFAYNTFQPKKSVNKKQDQPPKGPYMLSNYIQKNG